MNNFLIELKNICNKIPSGEQNKDVNIFKIGTRGFYENPFTEILSFLLNNRSQYTNRELFTRIFLESLPDLTDEIINSFLLDLNVNTQYTTKNKNFIDLIIFNTKYILVFENKINHWLANPFEDYEIEIREKYSSLIPFFYVLSYKATNPPLGWKNITIDQSFLQIKNKLLFKFNNKWDFYINDFLEHYLQTNKEKMTQSDFDFYSQNFSKIIAGNEYVNQFISETADTIRKKLPIDSINRTDEAINWVGKYSRAIRFYPFNSNDNVVLIFRSDGKFSLGIYYYREYGQFINEISNIVGIQNYRNWQERIAMCFTLKDGNEFKSIHDAINECIQQIEKMIKYLNIAND